MFSKNSNFFSGSGVTRGPVGDGIKSTSGPKVSGITICTWNIVDGRGNRLELACNRLNRLEIDVALLTETKLNGRHTVSSYGYSIVTTKCRNPHQGGVALCFRNDRNWHIESPEEFGDNVLRCTLVYEGKRTVLVGIYIPPSEEDLETIRHLDKAVRDVDSRNLVLLGDLNIQLDSPKDERAWNIAEAIKTFGMKNLASGFKPRRKKCFDWSWRTFREGRRIQSLCDYMLYVEETKWQLFIMIDEEFDSDHRL